MIKQVEIINYQSHDHSLLEFSEGLNIIKGRSHSGKSSIIRAMRWALENKPLGDKHKGNSKDDSFSVSILFSDDKFITREKGRTSNLYRTSEHEDSFNAIRSDVPDEIRQITRTNSSNIHTQHPQYFLLDKTSGHIAKEIGKVVGLEIIDKKKAKIKKIISDFTNKISVIDSQINDTKSKIEDDKFKILKESNRLILKIDETNASISTKIGEIEGSKYILGKISEEKDTISKLSSIISLSDNVRSIDSDISSFTEKQSLIGKALVLHSSIISFKKKIDINKKTINIKKHIMPIGEQLSELSDLEINIKNIKNVYRDIKNKRKSIAERVQLVASYKKIKKELEKKLDYCPACGAHKKFWKM